MHTGEVVAVEGQNQNKFLYTLDMADAICNLIREGLTMQDIAKIGGMPPLHLIYKWKNIHPDFADRIKKAKGDRAEYYHDKAVAALDKADGSSKDEVPGLKLQFDGYLKLAEKNNPEEYAAKPDKVAGAGTTVIMINTGINRRAIADGTNGIIEGETIDHKGQSDGVGVDRDTPAAALGAEIYPDDESGAEE